MSCIPINDFSLITLCDATKAGKLYSIVPDSGAGDFDVTRASTATYLGSDGLLKTAANNEPRIEFNADGTYKGLLVEPAATNLVLYSEEFDDAYWTKNNATINANDAVAPDGTTTADKLVPDTSNAIHSVHRVSQSIIGRIYSVFVKADGYEWILLTSHSSVAPAPRGAFFNVSNGTIGTTAAGVNAKIEDYGDGWYRCSISEGDTPSSLFTVIATNDNNVLSFEGNGTDGVLIWGAQNEQGTVATSYIPTVASTVTRAADSISKTGASALIGQTEGTLYAEVDLRNLISLSRIFALSDNSASNRIITIISSNTIRVIITNSGVTQMDVTSSIISSGTFKIALGYKNNDVAFYLNGNLIATNTIANIPACNNIFLGKQEFTGPFVLNDHIRAAALLPTRLSNAQLEALTTI